MATSNKAQDPEAAALSAIEEALNLAAASRDLTGDGPKEPELSTPIFPKASDPDKTPKLMRRTADGAPDLTQMAITEDRSAPRLPEVEDHRLFAPKGERRADRKRVQQDPTGLPPMPAERGEQVRAVLHAGERRPALDWPHSARAQPTSEPPAASASAAAFPVCGCCSSRRSSIPIGAISPGRAASSNR